MALVITGSGQALDSQVQPTIAGAVHLLWVIYNKESINALYLAKESLSGPRGVCISQQVYRLLWVGTTAARP